MYRNAFFPDATFLGDFGEDAYQSGSIWLIDTTGSHFQRWLPAYSTQPRVKGQLDRKPQYPEN